MNWLRYLALIAATAAIGVAADQPAKDTSQKTNSWPRVRLGGITVGAGYSHFSGPYPYYAGYPFAWGYPYLYGPFLFTPYAYPGFYTGYGYGPGMGEVKLQTADKNAWVYLDGTLAGRADKLKTMWLEPGAYNLEVRSADRKFEQRVYVLSGKTLKVRP